MNAKLHALRTVLNLARANKTARRASLIGGVICTLAITSCMSVDRTVMVPPTIAGATYVGSEECAACHEDVMKDFPTASHARLAMNGDKGLDMGCESCHGPGSLHVEQGGAQVVSNIVNPGRSSETCYQCHLDKRGEFSLASSHPVKDGRLTCTDCHNPHKGGAVMGGGKELHEANETCFQCHAAQKGPFVFPHQGLRDGCLACHEVHGSVNAKLLKVRNNNLCLQCHLADDLGVSATGATTLTVIEDHASRLNRGTCWVAGCHEAVHGSNASKALRY
ncbi:MAG: cytochrome c3 family protein [Verrucomicrobiota bacterium]|nr:cytochrome c3 family protein [Verrucomicrobiota bacterium]